MSSISSESDVKFLNNILVKLVQNSSEKLAKKGYEHLRLLKLKRGAGLMNMSDTCAGVVCLNLAADKLGYSFDKPLAIKMAGVTKKNYVSLYHTVEKVLGLDKPLTVNELCNKLECSNVSDLAQRLIDRYICNRDEGIVKCPPIDLSHPMYACAAVLAACRHRKVRVKREPLVEACRVKGKDLDKLAAELAPLAEETDRKTTRKRRHYLIDVVEQMVKESQKSSVNLEEEEEEKDNEPKESFSEWKKRILAKTVKT